MLSNFRPSALALACIVGAIAFGQPAAACSLTSHGDNGRYIGGDLVSQIAANANTIQIVRVKARHLVRRTFTQGDWFLQFGDTDVPEGHPEFIDFFVFELEPVETLKIGGDPAGPVYDRHLRVAGYDPGVFGSGPEMAPGGRHPNSLPDWLFERPGDSGYAFIGASEGSGLGGGECTSPYFLQVGQTLVALRNSTGRLYRTDGAFPLRIETRFLGRSGRSERVSLAMQSLIPVTGPDDPLVSRLRQTVAAPAPGR